jgi:anti-sigma B factor antagonist
MTLAPPTAFSSRATVADGHAVVAVYGELDLSTAPVLSQCLAPVIGAHPCDLILDLAGLHFIDSTGLTLIVRASNALKVHQGTLGLAHPTAPVRRVLELVGLDRMLVA